MAKRDDVEKALVDYEAWLPRPSRRLVPQKLLHALAEYDLARDEKHLLQRVRATDIPKDEMEAGLVGYSKQPTVDQLRELAFARGFMTLSLEERGRILEEQADREVAEQPAPQRRLKDGYSVLNAFVYEEYFSAGRTYKKQIGKVGTPEVVRCYESIPPAPGEPTNIVYSAVPAEEYPSAEGPADFVKRESGEGRTDAQGSAGGAEEELASRNVEVGPVETPSTCSPADAAPAKDAGEGDAEGQIYLVACPHCAKKFGITTEFLLEMVREAEEQADAAKPIE